MKSFYCAKLLLRNTLKEFSEVMRKNVSFSKSPQNLNCSNVAFIVDLQRRWKAIPEKKKD